MEAFVFLEVSDRNEVEGIAGLHARMLFKIDGRDESFVLAGTASFSDEMEIAAVQIVKNELGVNDMDADVLLKAACATCWNSIMVELAVAAGMNWQSLGTWLSEYTDAESSRSIAYRIRLTLLRVTA